MSKYLVLLGILFIVIAGFYYSQIRGRIKPSKTTDGQQSESAVKTNTNAPATEEVASGLDTPWSLVFLPDNSILVSERKGTVRKISSEGVLDSNPLATLSNVLEIGEGGLLGMTLHPKFKENKYIYFYYTYRNNGENTLNRVVRMTYENNQLSTEEIIVDAIPGASNHNGGEIAFGPDSYLYITTGDAQEPSQAQDSDSLAGKILRVTETGEAAPNNPFNNRTYSYGHRNSQGIVWDEEGNLWSTEHGRSGVTSGLDEINVIKAGINYGWPDIQGNETASGMQGPVIHSGNTTWAPGSITFYKNAVYFSGLRGAALYKGSIENNSINTIDTYLQGEYGRIREVIVGPDEMIYITTSNKDGRGIPTGNDDKVIRINPEKL